MIGTTHFTNAVVQRRHLAPVAAIRIGLPASASLPPFVDWPDDLARIVRGQVHMLEGGHEYDGRPLVPFDVGGHAGRRGRFGIRAPSVGIASVFSPLDGSCEAQAAEILREACPDVAVTLSHHLGRIGLLERENVTLLNACLRDLARATTRAFVEALSASGIGAPLYLTQNDGTVMLASEAEAYPVYGFASGPTNSMRGAAFLSRLDDAIVVDVGGTTTTSGASSAAFPARRTTWSRSGGVRTLFRMPDLLSLGLGGGSLVREDPLAVGPLAWATAHEQQPGLRRLGADGDGRRGGGGARRPRRAAAGLPVCRRVWSARALAHVHALIEEGVDRMKTDARRRSAGGGRGRRLPDPGAPAGRIGDRARAASGRGQCRRRGHRPGDRRGRPRSFRPCRARRPSPRPRRLAEAKAVRAGAARAPSAWWTSRTSRSPTCPATRCASASAWSGTSLRGPPLPRCSRTRARPPPPAPRSV